MKLVVVVGVVAVAGVSRWLASQSAVTGAEPRVAGAADEPTSRAMHRAVRLEVAGMVLVLAMTAGLVESPPPRAEALDPVTVSGVEGDRIAQIVLDPPVTGGTTMHVYVTSTTGTLVKPVATTVTASLPAAGIEQLDLPLVEEAPGHLSSDAVVLPIAGRWTFTIQVRYSEFDRVQFTLQAEVR